MRKGRGNHLEFSTIFNVRDLGGIETANGPIKTRHFLRSGDTMFLSEEDLEALLMYGVSRVLDLRSSMERPELSDPFARVPGVTWANIAMEDDHTMTPEAMGDMPLVEFIVEGNRCMLNDREAVRGIMAFLAQVDPGDCVLYHCAAGMDRTGMVTLLILGAAGVSRDEIVSDYAYSFGTDEQADEVLANWDHDADPPERDGIEARIWALYDVIDQINEEYGSVKDMMLAYGVPQEHIDAVVRHLTI